jgi:WhiB family transcriptional regulator, redox-sensing transcriptional regulator
VTAKFEATEVADHDVSDAWDETLPWSVCFESRPAWMGKAACKGEPSSAFFSPSGIVSKRAKALCDSCEVRVQCLAYAIATPDLVGTWAGTSQRGRRALRVFANAQKAGGGLPA